MVQQYFVEVAFLAFGEILAALSFLIPARRPNTTLNQFLAVPKYIVAGFVTSAIFSAFTLLIAPQPFITNQFIEIGNVIATPLLAGFFMSIVAESRLASGKNFLRANTFLFGFVFGLTFVIIRQTFT